MSKLAIKLGAGATAAAMATLMFAGSAFAAGDSCTIKYNGAFSTNKCKITRTTMTFTSQKNFAAIGNLVIVGASTGGNTVKNTTGGDASVDSGNVDIVVTITNTVNQTNK